MKLMDWSKYSSVLSKRVVGAFQKNRWFSAKESSDLSKRIDDAKREDKVHTIYRSIDGRRLSSPVKGLNIVETVNADGSKEIKKVLYK